MITNSHRDQAFDLLWGVQAIDVADRWLPRMLRADIWAANEDCPFALRNAFRALLCSLDRLALIPTQREAFEQFRPPFAALEEYLSTLPADAEEAEYWSNLE